VVGVEADAGDDAGLVGELNAAGDFEPPPQAPAASATAASAGMIRPGRDPPLVFGIVVPSDPRPPFGAGGTLDQCN
jgi:hypothetical protein